MKTDPSTRVGCTTKQLVFPVAIFWATRRFPRV